MRIIFLETLLVLISVNAIGQTESILHSEDFNGACISDLINLPKGWSVDDGSTLDFNDGTHFGQLRNNIPGTNNLEGFGVYTCPDIVGSQLIGGTNYNGFDGGWLKIGPSVAGSGSDRPGATYMYYLHIVLSMRQLMKSLD